MIFIIDQSFIYSYHSAAAVKVKDDDDVAITMFGRLFMRLISRL
jgi:hypothetical protein